MKKTFTVQILVAGALAAGMWGIASADNSHMRAAFEPQQGRACTLGTLRGTYLFAASGFNIVGGVALPKAIHEAIEFNGDGALTVPAVTLSVNGNISHPPGAPGSYTVEADCSGTLGFSSGQTYDIVVALDGKTVWMFQTNPNTVFRGTATRLER
jgi:hypothetical protein